MRRRSAFASAMAGLVVAGTVGSVLPVQATISGGATLSGTLTLPFFPCPSRCGGSLAGSLVGTVSGVTTNGAAFVVEWPDPATTPVGLVPSNLSADFGYTVDCLPPIGVAPSLTGGASGTFTVTGGRLLVNGVVTSDAAVLTGNFAWQQAATAMPMTFDGTSVQAGGSTIATSLSPPLIGAGTLSFAPPAWVACPNQITLTATVAGVLAQPA